MTKINLWNFAKNELNCHLTFIGLLLLVNLGSQAQSLTIIGHGSSNLAVLPQKIDKFRVLDSSVMAITYESRILVNPSDPEDTQDDIVVLQIGKNVSKSYSKLLYQADSAHTALLKKGVKTTKIFQGIIPPIEVYKNNSENKITLTYRTFAGRPIYLYVEDKIKFDWKILPDKKKYLNYSCQKATTTFRGRSYEAWFTSEIPFSEGPNKFTGLPGLILQIQDTQGHYVYNCIGIQKEKKNSHIKMWNWKYEPTTRVKLNALLKQTYANPIAFLTSFGIPVKQMTADRKLVDVSKDFKCPYNPMELE